jgi:hypothetical protein
MGKDVTAVAAKKARDFPHRTVAYTDNPDTDDHWTGKGQLGKILKSRFNELKCGRTIIAKDNPMHVEPGIVTILCDLAIGYMHARSETV